VALDADDGSRPVLVPFVGAIVPEVNVAQGWLAIDPPPGLLDLWCTHLSLCVWTGLNEQD